MGDLRAIAGQRRAGAKRRRPLAVQEGVVRARHAVHADPAPHKARAGGPRPGGGDAHRLPVIALGCRIVQIVSGRLQAIHRRVDARQAQIDQIHTRSRTVLIVSGINGSRQGELNRAMTGIGAKAGLIFICAVCLQCRGHRAAAPCPASQGFGRLWRRQGSPPAQPKRQSRPSPACCGRGVTRWAERCPAP